MKRLMAIAALVLLCLFDSVSAQSTSNAGLPPFGTFSISDFDTINAGNLNINLRIPIFSKLGRGLSVSYGMSYNSSIYQALPMTYGYTWFHSNSSGSGWRTTSVPYVGSVTYQLYIAPPQACPNHATLVIRTNYIFHDGIGTDHSFAPAQAVDSDCDGISHPFGQPKVATDGSGLSLYVDSNLAVTITTNSGVVIHPSQSQDGGVAQGKYNTNPQLPGLATDTNGNQLGSAGSTDTLGTTPVLYLSNGFQIPSPTNPGTYVNVTTTTTPLTVRTNFQCANVIEYGPTTENLLTGITLPDGSSYSFTYEQTPGFPGNYTGRIASVRLPTGGTISYTYQGSICADASASGITRSIPGSTETYTRSVTQTPWGYNPPTPASITASSTTKTDGSGNLTVFTFTNGSAYETKRQIYSNVNGSQQLIETVETSYANGVSPITRRTVKNELPDSNGMVAETDTYYDSTGSLENDVYDYDYGSGQVGALLKHTHTDYASLTATIFYDGTSSYQSPISNRPHQVTVYDGSGTIAAQTTYGYDETAVAPSSGTPNHFSVTGSRGNQTTVTSLVATGTTVNTTKTYFDTGMVQTASDLRNSSLSNTTYSYSDTGGCGNAFVTTIIEPMNLTQHKTWDCNGGVPKTSTDENSQVTTFTYGDPNFFRLTRTGYPDGGYQTTTYNLGTNSPWNVIQATALDSSRVLSSKTIYDSFARVSQEQLSPDPDATGGIDYRDTQYDGNGRVASVSNWYRSTGEVTYGLTQYSYDGLGRTTKVTQPDGNLVQTSFTANCRTVTDEAGKQRYSCNDGLGRLAQVNEPGPTGTPGTPGSGTVTFSSNSSYLSRTICPSSCFTVYNAGYVYVTLNGVTHGYSYSGAGSVSAQLSAMASTIASAFNSDVPQLVSASATSSGITFTAVGGGTSTNYSLSYSCTYSTTYFSGCGFSASGPTALTGGTNGTPGGLQAPFTTLYIYDALGNLKCVEQHGTASGTGCTSSPSLDASSPWRVRRFSYDALSRLTSATNPEVGNNGTFYAINYYYTAANGSLCSGEPGFVCRKTYTGRNLTTTYSYDNLNRVTGKSYSDSTPAATYCYDGQNVSPCAAFTGTFGKARRTGTADGSGTAVWNYDTMGRPLSMTRTIGSVSRTFNYLYNYDGTPQTIAYPSGRTITYTYNGLGHVIAAQDTANAVNYAQSGTYSPWGALTNATLGADHGFGGVALSEAYNKRLEMTSIVGGSFLSLTYGYDLGGGANNGDVALATNNLDSSRTASYSYDQLNRLATALTPNANNWGNSYVYDAWGNLLQKNSVGKVNQEGLTANVNYQNQLNANPVYDAAGDVTTDNLGQTYTYDAENRVRTVAGVTYTYDADGNRVQKSNGIIYWTGAGGSALMETDLAGNLQNEYVFFGARRTARRDSAGNRYYYLSDHLGTSRVIFDQAGNKCYDADYYPWGAEQHVYLNTCTQNYKFTGKEHDSETGLDYFGARYYGSGIARFMSPDPKMMTARHIALPQKWNKYDYVQDNPLVGIDPDGLDDYYVFRPTAKSDGRWASVKAAAREGDHVYVLNGASATPEAYNKALQQEGAHVVMVGHTSHLMNKDNSIGTTTGVWLNDGRSGGGNGYTHIDEHTGDETQTSPGPQVHAGEVDIFGCQSIDLASQYGGAHFVGMNSGKDKLSSINAMDAAGSKYVKDQLMGNSAGAISDANAAFQKHSDPKLDKGDTVEQANTLYSKPR
jgi:RHS repeat-associated protein